MCYPTHLRRICGHTVRDHRWDQIDSLDTHPITLERTNITFKSGGTTWNKCIRRGSWECKWERKQPCMLAPKVVNESRWKCPECVYWHVKGHMNRSLTWFNCDICEEIILYNFNISVYYQTHEEDRQRREEYTYGPEPLFEDLRPPRMPHPWMHTGAYGRGWDDMRGHRRYSMAGAAPFYPPEAPPMESCGRHEGMREPRDYRYPPPHPESRRASAVYGGNLPPGAEYIPHGMPPPGYHQHRTFPEDEYAYERRGQHVRFADDVGYHEPQRRHRSSSKHRRSEGYHSSRRHYPEEGYYPSTDPDEPYEHSPREKPRFKHRFFRVQRI